MSSLEVAIPEAVMVIPADRAGRFAEHEAFVESCWLASTPRDEGVTGEIVPGPTLAQLWAAIEMGLIERPRTAERVAEFATPSDAWALCQQTGVGGFEILVTPTGPVTSSPYEFPAVARAANGVATKVVRRTLIRSCVPRDGRGVGWPAVRLVRRGAMANEVAALDVDSIVVCRYDDGDWAWVACAVGARPLGWIRSEYLSPEHVDAA
jgi:hypothetical protein